MEHIDPSDLDRVMGGADDTPSSFEDIRTQAAAACPNTAEKYGSIDPSTINRALALKMGEECIAEVPAWKRLIARGRINAGIDKAFPPDGT